MTSEHSEVPAPAEGATHADSQPRNIIVFSDGTGNSSAKAFRTNVWKMYKALDLEDPQNPKDPRQFAYYDNGVGTSAFRPLAILGGMFGVGLARNVRDLYAFVCRTYRPGDKIYVFGFSRGAFTVRVLVGLLMNQGIIRYDGNETELRRLVRAAYRAYRSERFTTTGRLVRPMRWLRNRVIAGWDLLNHQRAYDHTKNIGRENAPDEVKVEFVGVWDTVAAYGLPVDELTRAVDKYIWPLSMPDRDLSPRVRRALHALALDDERHTFHPQLWNEGPPLKKLGTGLAGSSVSSARYIGPPNGDGNQVRVDQERLSQVWFAGAHSDVGGGYADDAVSYVSFEWIRAAAGESGLRFLKPILDQYIALSDENGPINDSRRGLGGYYRYNPRRIERLASTDEVTIETVKIHESVLRRIGVGQDGYAPIVIPPDFQVVTINGEIVDNTDYLNNDSPVVVKPFYPDTYHTAREHVFNLVWWRRIVYFATLGATMLLVAMPLIWPPKADGACQSSWCIVSDLTSPVALVLPGASATWIETFSSHPGIFIIIATAVVVLVFAGSMLGARISDAMRLIWYNTSRTKPKTREVFPAPVKPGPWGRRIEALRLHKFYQNFFHGLTDRFLPALFLLAVVYWAVAIASHAIFALRDTTGWICKPSDRTAPVDAQTGSWRLTTSSLCASTGLTLTEGGTYRTAVAIPANDRWRDWNLAAGPYGVDPTASGASWQALGVPLRRHLTHAWFQPMARIGSQGSDSYTLEPKPSLPKQGADRAAQDLPRRAAGCGCDCGPEAAPPTIFSAEIVARTSGELFLYVNDAIGPPGLTDFFYGNNHGSACVTVERVVPIP